MKSKIIILAIMLIAPILSYPIEINEVSNIKNIAILVYHINDRTENRIHRHHFDFHFYKEWGQKGCGFGFLSSRNSIVSMAYLLNHLTHYSADEGKFFANNMDDSKWSLANDYGKIISYDPIDVKFKIIVYSSNKTQFFWGDKTFIDSEHERYIMSQQLLNVVELYVNQWDEWWNDFDGDPIINP